MIDPELEHKYDIIFSIFIGIIICIVIYSLFENPRTIIVEDNNETFITNKQNKCDGNLNLH
tara:strand:- start:245 stop:427 length:183 start_codon:yes stop_codon:yes gene_type:complete